MQFRGTAIHHERDQSTDDRCQYSNFKGDRHEHRASYSAAATNVERIIDDGTVPLEPSERAAMVRPATSMIGRIFEGSTSRKLIELRNRKWCKGIEQEVAIP